MSTYLSRLRDPRSDIYDPDLAEAIEDEALMLPDREMAGTLPADPVATCPDCAQFALDYCDVHKETQKALINWMFDEMHRRSRGEPARNYQGELIEPKPAVFRDGKEQDFDPPSYTKWQRDADEDEQRYLRTN